MNLQTLKSKSDNRIFILFLIATTIAFGIISYLTDYSLDDLFYLTAFKDVKIGTQPLDWGEYFDFFFTHYTDVNGRFGDKLLTLFLLLPKWLFALISAIMYGLTVFLSYKIIEQSGNKDSLLATGLIATTIIFLPWYDNIFVASYCVNYLWATPFALTAAYLILNEKKTASKGRFIKILPAIFIFIGGAWHEGFGIPLSLGFTLYALFERKHLNRLQITLIACWILGALTIIIAPGFWNRIDFYENNNHLILKPLIKFGLTMILMLTALAGSLLFRRFRKRLTRKSIGVFIICLGVIAGNILIVFNSFSSPRIFWFGSVFGIIGLFQIFYVWNFNIYKNIRTIANLIIIVVVMIHLVASIYFQYLHHQDYINVRRLFDESPTGQIYYDTRPFSPFFCLRKPYDVQFLLPYTIQTFSMYYDNAKCLSVIPATLKYAEPDESNKLSEHLSVYSIEGYVVSTDSIDECNLQFKFEKSGWLTPANGVVIFPYTNENGNRYYLIRPIPSTFKTSEKIEGVRITSE